MSNLANKDEALRCEDIARRALHDGNREKAVRFLKKSLKLYHTSSAEKLLHTVYKGAAKHDQRSSQAADENSGKPEGVRRRTAEAKGTPQTPQAATGLNYTPQQLQDVNAITKLRDYYQILGLGKTATDADIKKAYRKMALKFHPDKNGAPGADEAFKKVSAAYSCLIDAEKRKSYDTYGPEAETSGGHSQHPHFRQDMSPHDLFEAFFGGHGGFRYQFPHGQTRHFYQRARSTSQQPKDKGLVYLVQFLPLLVLFLFSFASAPGGMDEDYSLRRTASLKVQRVTRERQVPFYVSQSFGYRYGRDPRALNQVEEDVEKQYFQDISDKCRKERDKKRKLERRAKKARSSQQQEELLQKAFQMDMPSCEKVEAFRTGG